MYFRVLFTILLLATETAVEASWPPQYDYVTGYVNDSVTLSCVTNLTSAVDWWYQPSPSVSVEQVVMSGHVVYKFKNRFTANSSKTGISTYYNLIIVSLQMSDSGMYTCMEDAGLGGKFPKLLNVTNTTNPARVVTQPTGQNTADRTTDTESLLVSPLPHLTSSGSAIINETMTTENGSTLRVVMIIVAIAVITIIIVVVIILVCRRKRNRHAREPLGMEVTCTMSDAPLMMAEEGSERPAGTKIVNGAKSDTLLMNEEADAYEPPADNGKTHLVSPPPHATSNRSAIADDETTTVVPTGKSSVNDSSTQMTTDEPTNKDAAVSSKQAAESSSTPAAADTSVTSKTTGVPLQWRQIEVSDTVTGFDLMGNEIYITHRHKSSGVNRVSKFVPPYESLSEVCILGRVDVTDMVYWKPTKTSLKAVYIADNNSRCIWQVQVENGRKSKWLANNISPCSLSVSPRQGLVVSTYDHKVIIFTASRVQTIFTELMREFDAFHTIMSPDGIVFTSFRPGQKRDDLPDQSAKNIRVFDKQFQATFDTKGRCIFYEYGTGVITLLTDNGSQELMKIDDRQMGKGAKLRCIEMDSKTYILISHESRIVTYEINY